MMQSLHFLFNPRSLLAIVHDVMAVLLAWLLAYLLRFNFQLPEPFVLTLWDNLIWVACVQVSLFFVFGLYRGVWRFASTPDLRRILKAVGLGALVIAVVYLMMKPFGVIPRSVFVLFPVLLVLMMGGSRFVYRVWKEHRLYGGLQRLGKPVLIVGAGDAAIALVKDLTRSEDWQVIGLLDDDKKMVGRQLMGVKVLGTISEIAAIAAKYQIGHAIIAMPAQAHQARRYAVDRAKQAQLSVLTVPAFEDLISGKLRVSQIRQIEVEDLLGREPVQLDVDGLQQLIQQQTVLVSGAGGSIGSELCRQILKYQPSHLVCVDISEYALYQLEQFFSQNQALALTQLIYLTADVKNAAKIDRILKRYQPAVVFHAAAYKHVPLMEHMNVAEALANNVLGTYVLGQASKQANVARFVLISTDKAVNPTNVMGASKRLAEMVCQGLQDDSGTQFVIVRFGNVLGSSGSVIPKFREQIAMGGPITVTHPEITRYFMSIPEAAQLVMQAGLMGARAEIYVLDMGEPVKIAELALDMIRLSGLSAEDIKIVFTGLRPGEKLYEELLADDEHTLPTHHQKIRIASARKTDMQWVNKLIIWVEAVQHTDELAIKNALKSWVEEYKIDTSTHQATPLTPETTTIH